MWPNSEVVRNSCKGLEAVVVLLGAARRESPNKVQPVFVAAASFSLRRNACEIVRPKVFQNQDKAEKCLSARWLQRQHRAIGALRLCELENSDLLSPKLQQHVDVVGLPFRRLLQDQLGFALIPAEGSQDMNKDRSAASHREGNRPPSI